MRGRYFPWSRGQAGSSLVVQASPGGEIRRAEPGPTGGGPSWRAIRRLLTAFVLARGLMLMCVLPPLEGWDEYQHVAYVHLLHETGRRPVYDEAVVPGALFESVLKLPQGCDVLKELRPFGAVGYAEYWARRDAGDPMTPTQRGTPALYEAQHGPLYYRLAAPLYAALGGEKDLRRSVAGLRVANLLLIVGAVWVALGAIGRLVRDVRHRALIGLVVAAHPLFLVNGIRVANDALGAFLATVAIAGALTLDGRHLTRRALWVGPVIGFAVLAKAVHLALAPFAVALWLAVVVLDRIPKRRAVIALAVLALGILVPTLSQFAEDLAHYGNLTPMVEAMINRRAGRTTADLVRTAVGMNWPRAVVSWWARKGLMVGGWSFVLPPRWLVDCYTLLVGLGLGGWAWSALGRGGRVFRSAITPAACAALAASYTATLAYHAIHSTAAVGFAATNAWYAAAAMPWFLALVAGGALGWPLGPLRFAGPALMGLAFIVAEGTVIWGGMATTYAGGLGGWAGLARLAALQPAGLGTATLFAATLGALSLLLAWAVAFVRLGTTAESMLPRGPHAEAGRLDRPASLGSETVHTAPRSNARKAT